MNHDDARARLDAYLDCELAAADRWAVAAHVADCPECARAVAAGVAQRQRVRAAFAAPAAPAGLADRIRASLDQADADSPPVGAPPRLVAVRPTAAATPRRRFDARGWAAFAAALVLLVGGAALLGARWGGGASGVGLETVAQHRLFAQDESLLDVTGSQEAIAAWLGNHLAFGVPTPEVPGYELLGARLVTEQGQPAAQLVYERGEHSSYLSLICAPARPGDPPPATTAGTTATYSWDAGALGCTLVADRSPDDLRAIAGELKLGIARPRTARATS